MVDGWGALAVNDGGASVLPLIGTDLGPGAGDAQEKTPTTEKI
jgi:hypothetical protein